MNEEDLQEQLHYQPWWYHDVAIVQSNNTSSNQTASIFNEEEREALRTLTYKECMYLGPAHLSLSLSLSLSLCQAQLY
jgi:hypothetical protein